MSKRFFLAFLFAFASLATSHADDAKDAKMSPTIEIKGAGALTSRLDGDDAFVAQFTPISPQTVYCSGTCEKPPQSLSWTCEDGKNCHIDCVSNPAKGKCE